MSNIFTQLFTESYERELDISRVRKDFRDQVFAVMRRHLKKGRELADFVPSKLNRKDDVVGGSFMTLCQGAFKTFDEGIVEELLELSGGKRPSAGPGEILLASLFSNVSSAAKGDVIIDGHTCEIKSIRGGGGPYDRGTLKDKLKLWGKEYGYNLTEIDWNPSGIGELIPALKEMENDAKAELAAILVGPKAAKAGYEALEEAEESGPRILLQRLASCQLKNYCDSENGSDLLVVMPEEKKYLWMPNAKILEVGNYVKFGGWSQYGFMISKLKMGD